MINYLFQSRFAIQFLHYFYEPLANIFLFHVLLHKFIDENCEKLAGELGQQLRILIALADDPC